MIVIEYPLGTVPIGSQRRVPNQHVAEVLGNLLVKTSEPYERVKTVMSYKDEWNLYYLADDETLVNGAGI